MRYRRIKVHGQIFINIFCERFNAHIRCVSGLPEGTRFAYAVPTQPEDYGCWIVVEHESFDLIPDGGLIPEHTPMPNVEVVI